jgi:hypothetical protein
MLLPLALLLVCAAAAPPPPPTSWSYAPHYENYCVDGSSAVHPANRRLVFVALPVGPAPREGWPIYFWFTVDSFSSKNHTFGGPPGTPGSCEPVTREPDQPVPQNYDAFAAPGRLLDACVGIFNGSQPFSRSDCSGGEDCVCDYDQLSGALWAQREKAEMVSRGVAVVLLNPWGGDAWDAGPPDPDPADEFPGWGPGPDAPVFDKLFALMKSGELGPLDMSTMMFRGWSGGAQMVSWMVQLSATGALAALGGDSGAKMVGGVYTSGGSYNCYPANSSSPGAFGVCRGCNASSECVGGDFNSFSGCSTCTKNCGALKRNGSVCCSKCCPTGYTEQYYHEHPEDWSQHPPAFLAQGTTRDGNADLCAARNYHDTLTARGVHSTLVLQPSKYETCGCLGQRGDPAAASSPYLGWCEKNEAPVFCHMHVMAFASMLDPLYKFVEDVLANVSAHRTSEPNKTN